MPKNNVTFIDPRMEKMNINDIWYSGLVLFCRNISADYFRITSNKLTMAEIDQFTDTMKLILQDQNGITTEADDGADKSGNSGD